MNPEVLRKELVALIEGSIVEIAGGEHWTGHSAPPATSHAGAGSGALETLRRYGRPWFALWARRHWKKVGAETLDLYREEFVAKAGTA